MTEKTDKPKIFVLDRYSLFAQAEGNKKASLEWGLREGYPRITVWTRSQTDNDGKGFLTAAFDLNHFLFFLTRLEHVARQKEEIKEQAITKHFPRDAKGDIKGPLETSCEVWFGKDADGVVWIALSQKDRPKIKFEIVLSDFHEFKSGGQPIQKAQASTILTLVTAGVLREWFTRNSLTMRDTSVPRENKGPYSSRPKNTGYSGASATADAGDFNEDLPF